jgi:hypothetical protein
MSARLVVQKGPQPNQEFLLTETAMSVGRSPDNEITIQDPEISRRHARISYSGGLYQIEDSGSTNGSFVNGRRVQGAVILQHGDRVQLGESIVLVFQEDSPTPGYGREWDDEWVEDDAWDAPAQTAARVVDYPGAEPAPQTQSVPVEWGTPAVPETAVFDDLDSGPSRTRQLLLGCGCGFLLFGVLCIALLFFLDAYDQGRLLYCGPLFPVFELLLGPFGFNPACPPPA